MPEYHLPGKDSPEFKSLPAFAQGYIEAAFFTAPDDGEDDMSGKGFADLDPATLEEMLEHCAEFRSENAAPIEALIANGGPDGTYDEVAAGRDFWYTRNGHGVGYWDRGFPEDLQKVVDDLTAAADCKGVVDLYLGDNDSVYEM